MWCLSSFRPHHPNFVFLLCIISFSYQKELSCSLCMISFSYQQFYLNRCNLHAKPNLGNVMEKPNWSHPKYIKTGSRGSASSRGSSGSASGWGSGRWRASASATLPVDADNRSCCQQYSNPQEEQRKYSIAIYCYAANGRLFTKKLEVGDPTWKVVEGLRFKQQVVLIELELRCVQFRV